MMERFTFTAGIVVAVADAALIVRAFTISPSYGWAWLFLWSWVFWLACYWVIAGIAAVIPRKQT